MRGGIGRGCGRPTRVTEIRSMAPDDGDNRLWRKERGERGEMDEFLLEGLIRGCWRELRE